MLTGIKNIAIPEGTVKQIASGGVVFWQAQPESGSIVPGLAISYTGAYTDQKDVVMSNGQTYRLLTLTESGTLTLDQSVKADVWLCNGGNGGESAGTGGGGGYFVQNDAVQLETSTVCIVGAGQIVDTPGERSAFGTIMPEPQSDYIADGASGGGNGGASASSRVRGIGTGKSTVPFLDTEHFEPHSAGGGGGGRRNADTGSYHIGGAGGSDGADGEERQTGTSSNYVGGDGGIKGGGVGGKGASNATGIGGDATFYGSGGGGGGYYKSSGGTVYYKDGGAGYQGVIYVRIPYDQ